MCYIGCDVFDCFHLVQDNDTDNPSCRTMSLGLTQPLIGMSTKNISWGQRQPVRRAYNLTTFMCRLS